MGEWAEPAKTEGKAGPRASLAGHRDGLVRVAYRFLWNRDDAEEIAQEALAAGLASLDRLRDPDKLGAYLARVTVNLALMRRRSHRPTLTLGHAEQAAARERPPDAEAAGKELEELVLRLAARLPRRQEVAFVLKDVEDWAYPRIAEAMGITQAAARTHVHTARMAMREMIRREAPEWDINY